MCDLATRYQGRPQAGHDPAPDTRNERVSGDQLEVGRAVYRGFPLIVVRLDSIPVGKRLSYHLSQRPFQRVDAVEPPLTQHLARLMQIVESALGIAAGEAVAAPRLQGALPPISSGADAKAATAKGSPLRERVAFISYSDADEVASHGALLGLRSWISQRTANSNRRQGSSLAERAEDSIRRRLETFDEQRHSGI